MFKNWKSNDVEKLVNNFWSFIAFLFIAYGCILIHPGLVWITLGLYIIKSLYTINGLFNIFISIPPNINISSDEDEEDDESTEDDEIEYFSDGEDD